jgi:predicted RNA-binding Zn-ribbon protein involved in translation (DUF1610 family)
MPRNTITKELTYDERLVLWEKGQCPYCGSNLITVKDTKRGGKHFRCHKKKCRAENHFSRRNTQEKEV